MLVHDNKVCVCIQVTSLQFERLSDQPQRVTANRLSHNTVLLINYVVMQFLQLFRACLQEKNRIHKYYIEHASAIHSFDKFFVSLVIFCYFVIFSIIILLSNAVNVSRKRYKLEFLRGNRFAHLCQPHCHSIQKRC